MLFVDVSLGNQKNQRIVVNEGDSPSQLAEDFARAHGKLDGFRECWSRELENWNDFER